MSDVYVYSTATASTAYTIWNEVAPGGIPSPKRSITINGGANLADKSLVTPYGVVTKISSEDLALLENNRHFQQHVDAGFIMYSKNKEDPNKVASDMVGRDKSAPLVPQDYEFSDEGPKPVALQGEVKRAVGTRKVAAKK